MKDREKMVHDLVATFKDMNELHIVYKERMKNIIGYAVSCLAKDIDKADFNLKKWVDQFVEENFKAENES